MIHIIWDFLKSFFRYGDPKCTDILILKSPGFVQFVLNLPRVVPESGRCDLSTSLFVKDVDIDKSPGLFFNLSLPHH